MKYHYFVYYKAECDGCIKECSGELVRDKKIKTSNDVSSIEKSLAITIGAKNAILCNYIFLRRSIK